MKGGNTFAWRSQELQVFDQASPYAAQLPRSLHDFFPSLKETPVTANWNGPSDRSVSGLPFFGRFNDEANIFYAIGYSGNGIDPSYIGGHFLSSLLLNLDKAWTRPPDTGFTGSLPSRACAICRRAHGTQSYTPQGKAEDENRRPWMIDRLRSQLTNAAGKSDKA